MAAGAELFSPTALETNPIPGRHAEPIRNEQLLTFENLRRLTRFSWFYNGYLPAAIRQALYRQLDEATRLLIHQAIYEWLKEQARDPDPEWRQEVRLTELLMALHKAAAGLASSQELSELRRQVRESGYLQLELTDDFAEYELQPLPPELLRSLTTSDPLETAAVWSRRIVQRAAEFFQPSPIAAPSAEQAPVPLEDIPREDPAPSGSRPDMVFIPPGTFQMGDVMGDKEGNDETVHEVKLSAFHLGRYAVTFDEFDAFCEATGREKPSDSGWGRGRRPVINVNWYDAVEYCNWLSELWGLKPAYAVDKSRKDPNNKSTIDNQKWLVTFDPKADGFRLPTEAEWEYAPAPADEVCGSATGRILPTRRRSTLMAVRTTKNRILL
jgi:formylglycine-generating enzyme required for sulfatase activity